MRTDRTTVAEDRGHSRFPELGVKKESRHRSLPARHNADSPTELVSLHIKSREETLKEMLRLAHRGAENGGKERAGPTSEDNC